MESLRSFQNRVAVEAAGSRVDVYLAKRFQYFSRQKWQQVIRAKQVLLDGVVAMPSKVLRGGEILSYTPELAQEPPVETQVDVLFEDEVVLAINKPAPCPTTQCGGYLYNTVECLIEQYLQRKKGKAFWMLHRLDLETSGVLLVAKRLDVARQMYQQFEQHRVIKSYVCITKSTAEAPLDFFQSVPMGPCEHSLIRIKTGVRFSQPTQSALTFFTTVSAAAPYFLIRCRLFTGRTNQIRVHLGALGHWIVGDKLHFPDEHVFDRYSQNALTDEDWRCLEVRRMLLHAVETRFTHPLTEQEIVVRAPLKHDISEFALAKQLTWLPRLIGGQS